MGNKRLVEQVGLYPRAGVDAWKSHSLSVSQKALAGQIGVLRQTCTTAFGNWIEVSESGVEITY